MTAAYREWKSLSAGIFIFCFYEHGEEKGIFAGIQGTPNTFSASSQFGRNTNEHFLTLLRTIHEKDKKNHQFEMHFTEQELCKLQQKVTVTYLESDGKMAESKNTLYFSIPFSSYPLFRSKHAK